MTPPIEKTANEHCCEEAAIGFSGYVPCNKPAQYVVGWKGRDDKPIRMCAFCADHNVKNRGGQVVSHYGGKPMTTTPTTTTPAAATPLTDNPRVTIGGNAPPIADQLAMAYEDVEADVAATLEFAREQLPPTVESDDDVALLATFIKERVKPLQSRIGKLEEFEKRPLMNATAAVRGFWNAKAERIDKMMAVLNGRKKKYDDAKAAAARAEAARLAEEQRRAAEAARVAADDARALADRASAEQHTTAAQIADIQARNAERLSVAKPAEHTRVKAASGATATTQTFWDHEIVDMAAIPIETLWPFVSDQAKAAAVAAFVKAGNRELPGVRIFENSRPVWR